MTNAPSAIRLSAPLPPFLAERNVPHRRPPHMFFSFHPICSSPIFSAASSLHSQHAMPICRHASHHKAGTASERADPTSRCLLQTARCPPRYLLTSLCGTYMMRAGRISAANYVRRGGIQPSSDFLDVGARGCLVQGVYGVGGQLEGSLQKLHVSALPSRPKRRVHQHRLRPQPPLPSDLTHVTPHKVDRHVVLPLRHIPLRHRQGILVDIDGHHVRRAHYHRPNAQHRRATPEIEYTAAVQLAKRFSTFKPEHGRWSRRRDWSLKGAAQWSWRILIENARLKAGEARLE
eukprot:CAMPEP_0177770666 /NCGR_PEP_ID=MMETSP0491_2-20121128/11078_1 /TAXON_ID=63592 /ORGANISM="Tetraselmis chuii, Strain PLY429" /LENGTH=289 /DNA_ID=CAMNT_0019287959 /DNA_START=18 /DNA_END=889 /DNA_ORIENTATION=+